MDGVRLNDNESLEKLGVDKQRIVEEITCAYAHQIYVDGFFNGDPHPGMFEGLPFDLLKHVLSFHLRHFTLNLLWCRFHHIVSQELYVLFYVGNFLVGREPPHHPILLDFGLTKSISSSTKQALAKMFLACAEVSAVI